MINQITFTAIKNKNFNKFISFWFLWRWSRETLRPVILVDFDKNKF